MSKAITTTKLDITTPQQAMDYLTHMHNAGLLYHLDDDPADCLAHHCLTDTQLEAIEYNVGQLFKVDWSATAYGCPFGFIVDELEA